MPRKGFKCITVSEQIHNEIKTRANKTNQTIGEYIEFLLAKDKETRKGK